MSLTNCPLDSRLGSGKTVLHYTQGLRKLGHRVDVCEPNDYRLYPTLKHAKIAREAVGAWGFLRSGLRDQNIDLIEFYGHEFGLATWSLARRAQRPLLVAHTNGLELLASQREKAEMPISRSPQARLHHALHQRLSALLSWTAFARADAFVALCELDRQHVLELGYYSEERTAVVEPGLDEEYLSIPFRIEREERVAFTGSWIERKGISHLAQVMTNFLHQRPKLIFDIYGAGVPATRVLSYFPQEIHQRIQIHPRLTEKEIATGLARARVFFFPSQYEGFGIALAEAMACGCAVVTTPTGFGAGLENGKEGIICNFGDEEAMLIALQRLFEDNDLWRCIAESGWQRTRSLTWETNVHKLETVYLRWVAQHRGCQNN